ncbi:MAG: hypothetical protein HY231_20925 [Acidobacteria bacterium]|nr:hypothetical protein [Acidobacteriota bacterium]
MSGLFLHFFSRLENGYRMLTLMMLSHQLPQRLAPDMLSANGVGCLRLSQLFRCLVLYRLIDSLFPRPAIIPSFAPSAS